MRITLDLPDEIARELAVDEHALSRSALESIALEGYRCGKFSEEQVRRMLGFESRFDVHAFLKDHKVFLNFSLDDLEQDLATIKRLHL